MPLQAVMSQADRRLVSANRDVAHNFRFVVEEVARRLSDGDQWPTLAVTLLKPNHVTDDELGEACRSFILFVAGAVEKPQESMYELLERSGFFACNTSAQVAYMATLGQVMAGIYFQGAREATLDGDGPCSDVKELVAFGSQAADLMALPPWRRRWRKFKRDLAGKITAHLTGNK